MTCPIALPCLPRRAGFGQVCASLSPDSDQVQQISAVPLIVQRSNPLGQTRVEPVAQAVAQQIDGEHRQSEKRARNEDRPADDPECGMGYQVLYSAH